MSSQKNHLNPDSQDMLSQNVSPMLQTGHSLCQGKNCQASAKRHKYLGVKGACLLYFTKPFLCFHSLMSIVNSCTPAEKQTIMLPPLLLPIGCFPITFCLFQKPFAFPPLQLLYLLQQLLSFHADLGGFFIWAFW